ncbi:MAG: hypothetical protein GY754_03245 [bacterium]|nr:hypothetical protein [bacterium]
MTDKIIRGIIQNMVVAFGIYITVVMIGSEMMPSGKSDIGASAMLILESIPLSFTVSGIINGIYFNTKSCPRAARTNMVIAIISFIIGGTCMLVFVA